MPEVGASGTHSPWTSTWRPSSCTLLSSLCTPGAPNSLLEI